MGSNPDEVIFNFKECATLTKLRSLDLFSGIGGMTKALQEWVKPVLYCEIDLFCQSVLLSRMDDGQLPKAIICYDIAMLNAKPLKDKVDIIYAGTPCQGFSVAGFKRGLGDERSCLVQELIRICQECSPQFIFLENVPSICNYGGIEIVKEIASMGYDCRWCVISASSIGACHERQRWFMLAHAKGLGRKEVRLSSGKKSSLSMSASKTKHDTSNRKEGNPPLFCGMDDVIPNRMDRIKALGNSVVPLQVTQAFKILSGLS